MILAVIAAAAIGAAGAPPEAKLTWHDFEPNDEPAKLVFPSLAQVVQTQAGGTAAGFEGYSAPQGCYSPEFFYYNPALFTGAEGKRFVGVAGASSAGGAIDRVWVDWNEDKRFDASEMAKLSAAKDQRRATLDSFEYAAPPKGAFGPIHVKFVLDPRMQMIGLVPTGYMEGVVQLAGRETKVRVVHMNFGGAYGALVGPAGGIGLGDFMVIDAAEAQGTNSAQPRRIPLPAILQLADGNFWEPKLDDDGGKIAFVKNDAPTGTVAFVGATLQSGDLATAERYVVARPTAGKLTLPAGRYSMNGAAFSLADDAGKTWTYKAYSRSAIVVVAGSEKTVLAGGPLKLGIEALETPRGRMFILNVTDAGDASVEGLADPAGQAPPAVQLTISAPDGKVVATLPVANPSWGGRRPTWWTPAQDLKPGTYTASVLWDSCPFGKPAATTKFELRAKN